MRAFLALLQDKRFVESSSFDWTSVEALLQEEQVPIYLSDRSTQNCAWVLRSRLGLIGGKIIRTCIL